MKLHLTGVFLLTMALLFPPQATSQQAGKFDYYLLSLSWSPEFCYSHPSSPECNRHLGLVVHGLWPQYSNAGRGPENCSSAPGPSNPSSLLDIIPTLSLIQHEWTTHGTCSGLGADDYFALIHKLFTGIHVPTELQQKRQTIVRSSDLKHALERVNPGLSDNEIAFTCANQYLREVEICYSKDGKPQACSDVRDCSARSLKVPGIR